MAMFRKLVRKDLILATTCTLLLFGIVLSVRRNFRVSGTWSFTHSAIIEPSVSETWTSSKRILVCVASAAPHASKRDAIRETWGSHPSLRITFFLGFDINQQAAVIAEAQKYGDIVQYDFDESYRNLTLKTASMIHWANRHPWKERTLLFKIDDDVFLNTAVLESHIQYFGTAAIYGSFFEDIEPVRDPSSNYYLGYEEYYAAKFPTYLSGAFYVLHEQVIPLILETMCELSYLTMEDVFFTGLVADRANVKRIPFPQNARLLDVPEYNEDPLRAWFYGEINLELSSILAVHYVEPALQRTYWGQLLTYSPSPASKNTQDEGSA